LASAIFACGSADRKVLNALLDFAGIPHSSAHAVFRILDKIEKIGLDGVAAELTAGRVDASGDKIPGLGLGKEQVARIRQFVALPHGERRETLAAVTQYSMTFRRRAKPWKSSVSCAPRWKR